MAFTIDPGLFLPEAVSDETQAFNLSIIAEQKLAPDMWQFPPHAVRQARADGGGIFPVEPVEPSAQTVLVDTAWGEVPLRLFRPISGKAKGTYLHIHGGGWMLGTAVGQDGRLQEIADNCALNCVSVEYRLSPEHPFPAGPNDCEAAAEWLLNADHDLTTDFLAIGGESAGAHLAALTLLRLRNKLGHCPFHAAALSAGVYDLGKTASVKNWGNEKLILSTRDMHMFTTNFLQRGEDNRDPDISPLYASLEGMPKALFSVGTSDLLLDDTLLMATRWQAINGNVELDITPGGCHIFQSFRHLAIAKASNNRIDQFLVSACTET
ncbi:MAG: alpha/beta hydrolase fold domain-containing protein [Rhizobiaceae bacterium]